MPLWRPSTLAFGALALAACATFTAGSDRTTAGDGGVDDAAARADAESPGDGESPGPDAADAADDVGVPDGSLLTNGDFSLGCNGFSGDPNGMLTPDPTARSTPQSCRVCSKGNGPYAITQPPGATVPAGVYEATAYVRTAPSTTPATAMSLIVSVNSSGQVFVVNGPDVTTTWQLIKLPFSVAAGGSTLSFTVSSMGSSCFLIDDASLVRTK